MATLSQDKRTGSWRILFVNLKKDRKTIFLGRLAKRHREEALHRVEQLVELSITRHAMTPDLAQWVAELDDSLAAKLAKVGLIAARKSPEPMGILAYTQRFVLRLQAAKKAPTTVAGWQVSFTKLTQFVGPNTELTAVTAETAERFHLWLTQQGLADGSIAKHLTHVKRLWTHAIDTGAAAVNPFAREKHRAGQAKEKQFVPQETVLKVMEHADEAHRLILALARFAGMRAPSEPFSLRWCDIDFEAGALVVTSPKLKHRPTFRRKMPLFLQVREALERYRSNTTPEADGFVLPYAMRQTALGPNGYGSAKAVYPCRKICRAAGVEPWPSFFTALRSSRSIEVTKEVGAENSSAWLGHSISIAQKHYFRPLDTTFQSATTARF